tara:strand:+ start:809 stop:1675 length:867 start_codon:yes stop_codon:yes gene_type:complete
MTAIKASLVKKLREKTGLGMMDCKAALQESSGNIELAITNLRKSSALKAEKKSSRTAIEGVILSSMNSDLNQVVLLEVNCETDFVSKDKNFLDFCKKALEVAEASDASQDLLEIVAEEMRDIREELIQKIGENVVIRNVLSLQGKIINYYIHTNRRIGSVVSLKKGNQEVAKNIAMHIAALNPSVINPRDLTAKFLEQEKEIIQSQVQKENKTPDILEKMVNGRLEKRVAEVSLIRQPYVKDPNKSIEMYLQESRAQIDCFIRLEVGEGLEIDKLDFASEVKSQLESI